MKTLTGKTAIITGANQGLGLAIAREFIKEGANLILCARGAEKLKQASESLSKYTNADQVIVTLPTDVSSPESVRVLTQTAITNFSQIHILVNNAGVYGPMGLLEEVDWDEWVDAVKINLFGSVLMCRAMLPHFKANQYGKIIQLSGGGATNPLPRISAYAASKTAIIRLIESLAEELRGTGIDVNAIAPGALNTRLLDQVLIAGEVKVGKDFYARATKQKTEGGASLERAARLAVYLASAESDGITGKLISAVWDPWENFSVHRKEIMTSDIYTLRRIIPSERNMDWGTD